jgi:O-acetyl-ADP-ribose deacetylase (regulator of RNase III)
MDARFTRRTSASGATILVGTVEIQIRSEPLEAIVVNTDLDAIVSSDDSMLSMGGGVSAAIKSLAGSAIRDEVASDLPLPVGAIAVTSAGRLPIKYVIHAVTIDSDNRVTPTSRTIRQLTRDILSRCEALGIERVAIPALATGTAGVAPTVSAQILAGTIREHTVNPTVLKTVVLPIPNPEVFEAFARALTPPMGEDREEGSQARTPEDASAENLGRGRVPWGRADEYLGDARIGAPRSEPQPAGKSRSWLTRLRWPSRSTERQDRRSTQSAPVCADVTGQSKGQSWIESHLSRPLLDGRYVLLEEIGRGGMAVVNLGWDLVLRRAVAVKILRPDCVDRQSLEREAATAFELTHDGIVRLYHFEPAHAQTEPYLVMEYLAWRSGEKWIADAGESGLPIRAVQDVGVRVCDALAYAHSRRVLHLDIKPSNIFVDPAGESAKLGDFGLARFSSMGGAALQIKPVGTPAYMAPEQTAGARVSAATDVYQMAATLWDFLTGSPPKAPRLDVGQFAPDRRRLLTVLGEALVPDPTVRPTATQLRELVSPTALA